MMCNTKFGAFLMLMSELLALHLILCWHRNLLKINVKS